MCARDAVGLEDLDAALLIFVGAGEASVEGISWAVHKRMHSLKTKIFFPRATATCGATTSRERGPAMACGAYRGGNDDGVLDR